MKIKYCVAGDIVHFQCDPADEDHEIVRIGPMTEYNQKGSWYTLINVRPDAFPGEFTVYHNYDTEVELLNDTSENAELALAALRELSGN